MTDENKQNQAIAIGPCPQAANCSNCVDKTMLSKTAISAMSPASSSQLRSPRPPPPPAEIPSLEKYPYLVGIRYGYLQIQERFATDLSDLKVGDEVIMKTARGTEHGSVYAKSAPRTETAKVSGNVLRRMTDGDRSVLEQVAYRRAAEEKQQCIERIRERKMPMKIVATEHLFGGDKIIFYFTADGRVDFRELVKDLARRYHTRIEMRQIGVRDEARILSDYEHCGRELCCRTFLHGLETVTMRMAKTQKSTLDPSKISGHCGRLMCCLRYEDDNYQEFVEATPSDAEAPPPRA